MLTFSDHSTADREIQRHEQYDVVGHRSVGCIVGASGVFCWQYQRMDWTIKNKHSFAIYMGRTVCSGTRNYDDALAVAPVVSRDTFHNLAGKRDDVGSQCRLVIRCCCDLSLSRSMLTQDPARPSLGDAKFARHMIHACAARPPRRKIACLQRRFVIASKAIP